MRLLFSTYFSKAASMVTLLRSLREVLQQRGHAGTCLAAGEKTRGWEVDSKDSSWANYRKRQCEHDAMSLDHRAVRCRC